jgi:hypothetical protein
MKIRQTMMFTSHALPLIQSSTLGMARTARRWKSKHALDPVARRGVVVGIAEVDPKP